MSDGNVGIRVVHRVERAWVPGDLYGLIVRLVVYDSSTLEECKEVASPYLKTIGGFINNMPHGGLSVSTDVTSLSYKLTFKFTDENARDEFLMWLKLTFELEYIDDMGERNAA